MTFSPVHGIFRARQRPHRLTKPKKRAILFEVKQFEVKQFAMKRPGGESKQMHSHEENDPALRPGLCGKFPEHEPPQVVTAQMRRVNNLIGRKVNAYTRVNGVEDVTPMHGWILRYLYSRRGQPVYQRDIERDFAITRSTVTNILQLMERKGYIRRESVPEDARLKRLELTDAGAEAHEKMLLALFQTDEFISGLLTEQENAELLRLLGKLYEGLH
jgi:DNA-binding MarR family transcriptional regulator